MTLIIVYLVLKKSKLHTNTLSYRGVSSMLSWGEYLAEKSFFCVPKASLKTGLSIWDTFCKTLCQPCNRRITYYCNDILLQGLESTQQTMSSPHWPSELFACHWVRVSWSVERWTQPGRRQGVWEGEKGRVCVWGEGHVCTWTCKTL